MLRCSSLLVLLLTLGTGCATVRPGDVSELLQSETGQKKTLDSQLAMARLCERRGENDQARAMYEKVLQESPQHPDALHRLAVVFTRENRRAEARQYFEKALQITKSAELSNDRGYLSLLEGDYPAAESDFRQATDLKPTFTAAWTNLGLALGYQDKYEEAFAVFLRATNSPAQAHCNLGFVFSQQLKLTESQKHYRQALVHDPELKIAAEALLQVSASIAGSEPRTILRTVATRHSASPASLNPAPPNSQVDGMNQTHGIAEQITAPPVSTATSMNAAGQ